MERYNVIGRVWEHGEGYTARKRNFFRNKAVVFTHVSGLSGQVKTNGKFYIVCTANLAGAGRGMFFYSKNDLLNALNKANLKINEYEY